jgi:hypothetical protein
VILQVSVPFSVPVSVPVDVGRDQAAAAARRELAKAVYAEHRPSLTQRIVLWLVDKIGRLLSDVAQATPGGVVGLVVLALLVLVVVVVVTRRTGPLRRSAADDQALFVGRARSAAEYRAAADAAARAGDWDEAVRQRFRAVVRALEERDVLDARPGRTADEAAADAASAFPEHAAGLRAAARSFDDVAYGGRPRDESMDADLRALDDRLAGTRPLDPVRAAASAGFAPVR